MKVATKRAQLIQNCHGLTEGRLKFSGVISNNVAAPRRPTTAGRSPLKIDCTAGVFIYFRNIRLMSIMRMNDGSTRANVAVALPRIDIMLP